MTYEADLWACIRTRSGDLPCHGYRYVERGQFPGSCPQVVLEGYNSTAHEATCGSAMYFVGTFELKEEPCATAS